MVDQTRTRQREQESAPGGRYEQALEVVGDFVELGKNGTILIKEDARDWELCRQGVVKFYMVKDEYPDNALQDWYVFVHDIKKQSGKHRHQGGLVLFVIEGVGSTEVNGERIDWEEGDCILLPLHPDGIEHVHFNRGDGGAKWLAFVYEPCFNQVASELTQTAVYTAFTEQFSQA